MRVGDSQSALRKMLLMTRGKTPLTQGDSGCYSSKIKPKHIKLFFIGQSVQYVICKTSAIALHCHIMLKLAFFSTVYVFGSFQRMVLVENGTQYLNVIQKPFLFHTEVDHYCTNFLHASMLKNKGVNTLGHIISDQNRATHSRRH